MLEYCSPAWNPVYAVHSERLEKVQKRFLYHLSFKDNLSRSLRSYTSRLEKYKIETLKVRRDRADLIFLYKLLHGLIECPDLLHLITLNVPKLSARVIKLAPFTLPNIKTNLGQHAPIFRIMSLYNAHKEDIDIYHTSVKKLKTVNLSKNATLSNV